MMRLRLRLLSVGALLAALAGVCSPAGATQIERLLMPGEVSNAHAKFEAECSKCHDRTDKDRQTSLCLDCHKEIAADVKATRGFHGHTLKPGTNCSACHTEHKGRNGDVVRFDRAAFDHASTGYVLDGRHATTACAACHIAGKKLREAPTTCFACHTKVDIHKGKLGKECQDCHTTISFAKTKFDHGKTRFPLTGAHEHVACDDCHTDPSYKNAPLQCVACHSRDDAHKGSRGPACADCHNTTKWKDSAFDHLKVGHFALNGAHAKTACEGCHRSGDMKVKIPDKCAGCHAADDRHGGRFGDDCSACHNEVKWKEAKYDHAKKADWPLRGKHADLDCNVCHTSPIGKPRLPKDCFGCHKADDVHHGSMGEKCASCHSETGWKDKVRFDHDMTRFPLVGLHANVACEECHPNRAYRNTLRACYSCHKADDNHKGHLGKECNTCHNPNGWKFWQFDHGKATHFALQGKHAKLACKQCHIKPQDEVKPDKECASCHVRDDVHNGGFGRDCGRCHTFETWKGAGVKR